MVHRASADSARMEFMDPLVGGWETKRCAPDRRSLGSTRGVVGGAARDIPPMGCIRCLVARFERFDGTFLHSLQRFLRKVFIMTLNASLCACPLLQSGCMTAVCARRAA